MLKKNILNWLQYSWSCLGYLFLNLFIYFSHFIPWCFHLQIEQGKKWVVHMSVLCTFPVRTQARELELKPLWANIHLFLL